MTYSTEHLVTSNQVRGKMKLSEVDKPICNASRASEILDVPYTTLLYWIDSGLAHKDFAGRRKQGIPIKLSFKDLMVLNVIKDLRQQGASTQAIRSTIDRLTKESDQEWFKDRILLVVGEDIVSFEERPDGSFGQLISLLRDRGQLYLLDVGDVEEKVRKHFNQ